MLFRSLKSSVCGLPLTEPLQRGNVKSDSSIRTAVSIPALVLSSGRQRVFEGLVAQDGRESQ